MKRTDLRISEDLGLPLDLVTEATAIVATRGAGKSSTSVVLVEESFRLDVQSVVLDRTGVYWGLRSNAKGNDAGLPIYVLGGPHGDVPLEAHAGAMIADLVVESGHSFVLDLSDFSKAQAVRFAADFLERLYDRKARSRTTLLLVIDEAHFYAPQTPRGGFKGDSARLMGAMEDIVGLGRSRGIGVVLTTQRTQALNKAVLDLIETLIVMRMLSPRARDAVQDWIREKHEDDREGVIATLESLPTGTAWIWAPLRAILKKVAIRRIETFDSYATPKPGVVAREARVLAPIDVAALGAQIAATVEQAKENDPAELRKRIRVLEHDLEAQKIATDTLARRRDDLERALERRPEPEPQIEQVPVITESDRQMLQDAAGEIKAIIDAALRPVTAALASTPLASGVAPSRPAPAPDGRAGRGRPGGRTSDAGSGAGDGSHPGGEQSGNVTGAQQRIIDGLAWWKVIGVPEPTRGQLAFVVGYHPRSKGYTNSISALSTAGLLVYPSPGRVALTAAGDATAIYPANRPTEDELHRLIFEQIGPARTRILEALIRRHPNAVTRDELAEEMGYHPRSKGFTNSISRLSSLDLVEYPQPGSVRATELCFI